MQQIDEQKKIKTVTITIDDKDYVMKKDNLDSLLNKQSDLQSKMCNLLNRNVRCHLDSKNDEKVWQNEYNMVIAVLKRIESEIPSLKKEIGDIVNSGINLCNYVRSFTTSNRDIIRIKFRSLESVWLNINFIGIIFQ